MTGRHLQRIRESLSLTRKDFAKALGIGRNQAKEYEERTRVPRTVALAAKALQAGLDEK
jgi:DNA-binding transcriptional regulator YiaG